MTCCISWHLTAATSSDLTCSLLTVLGTTPSTVRSLYQARNPTIWCGYLGTRVTQEMHSCTMTGWCSPLMTAITTRGATATLPTRTTVQCTTAADSGTRTVDIAASPAHAKEIDSIGIHLRLEVSICSQHACGWCARSLRVDCADSFNAHSWSPELNDFCCNN